MNETDRKETNRNEFIAKMKERLDDLDEKIEELKREGEKLESEARKEYESRQWIEAGIDMLERGIRANPEKANLYQRMAELYWQRLEDYDKAAHYYRLASEKENAPAYVDRFIGYALEKAGKNEEAYAHWKKLAEAPDFQERNQKHREKVTEHLSRLEAMYNSEGAVK